MRKFANSALILLAAILFSAPLTDFDEANQLYDKGEYEKAAAAYEKIIAGGYESGEVYYDLGNTYYKLGDLALAIVNYERARKLMPGDEDLNENLKIIRLSLTDKVEESEAEPFFTLYSDIKNAFNIYTVKKAFLLLILITGAVFSLYFFMRNYIFGRIVFYAGALSLLTLLFFFYMYYDIYSAYGRRSGVVSADKISVMSSPDNNLNSKELFYLHLGSKAEILRSNEEWVEISFDSEKKGWVKKDEIIEI